MAVADFLLPGSFKSVPFLFRQTSKTQGRKIIVYEYPNSDRRDTVDLGELKPTYNITAYITGGDVDYYDNRRQLEQALSSFEKGVFIHPTDGEIEAQVSSYTVNESIQEIGRASYSITFIATTDPQFPTLSNNAQSGIENAINNALNAIDDAFNQNLCGYNFFSRCN
jgi:prophage DNA circulation protein